MSHTTAITAQHRERLALIYLRQSTPIQVREHRQSTARQYGLAEEAVRLGWAAAHVVTIDTDLGHSARPGSRRPGFAEVVKRVCLGEVGAIFGLEISRLARSSADLQRLLEFCTITDTLIIDPDGVYDLRQLNDRLIVGMKEQMATVELHVLASRMQESKRAAARRGELRLPLPVGYVYDLDGRTVLDLHDEIRAAITDLFTTFETTGSAYGVVQAFQHRPFPRRVSGGTTVEDVHWGRLTHDRVLRVLTNPAYAGAYVSGRSHAQRVVDADGTIRTRVSRRSAEQWPVLIQDHHPAYVSWDTFLGNAQRLANNNTSRGAHPPREGTALLQGIILCGTCGRSMTVSYSHGRPSYHCLTGRADLTHRAACRAVRAPAVDAAVVQCVLARVNPQEIALALAAADEVTDRRARDIRARELTLERARYEATRAERAFHQCDPENRLVARSLEQRWEAKLRAVTEAERAVVAVPATAVPLPARADLEALASDLPRLWHASTTSDKDRKRLLRTLVADVTVQSRVEDLHLRVGIRWQSGAAETLTIARPFGRQTAAGAVALVRQQVDQPDEVLATALNVAGFTTTTGCPFRVKDVRTLRRRYHLQVSAANDGSLPVPDVARRLGVAPHVVYYWLQQGYVDPHRDSRGRWRVVFSADVETACRQRLLASSRITPQIPQLAPGAAV